MKPCDKKFKLWVKLSVRIIVIFTAAIFASFAGDQLRTFLGDWHCTGSGVYFKGTSETGYGGHWSSCNEGNYHDPCWHWHYRHYLYLIGCILLMIVQIYEAVNIIRKHTKTPATS